ncbi:MAG: roadblock/LC7 domain-containing protein [Gemmatimonadaceae bacterium]
MTPRTFSHITDSLIRHRGVLGAMIVGIDDGMIVVSTLQIGVNGNAFAALSASLYRKARRSAAAAGFGATGFLELAAEQGRLCAAGAEELVIIVVCEQRVNLGMLRVELLRSVEQLP